MLAFEKSQGYLNGELHDQRESRRKAIAWSVAYQPILEDIILPQSDDIYKAIIEMTAF